MKKQGHIHPITQMTREMNRVFYDLGFDLVQGDEAVTSYFNFDSLNIPKNHPARESHDTFWLKNKIGEKELLRTHTSAVQVKYMQNHKPPYKVIVPGKVFRNEATDSTHETQFHQVEGFYVDKDVNLGHLKGVLKNFFDKFLGEGTVLRFRPGYFPFTEPSLEIDVMMKKADGSEVWVEVLGAGMIHPTVLKNASVDANMYRGFAFGIGVERMVMLKHDVQDIRDFYRGDLRFINQF